MLLLVAGGGTVTQSKEGIDWDAYLTLAQAAKICGLSVGSLRTYASRKDLRTWKPGFGRSNFTTRRWLHNYLKIRGTGTYGTKPTDLPLDYQAPPDDLPPEDENTHHAWPSFTDDEDE